MGAFFKVNDSQKKAFIAFNKNYQGICEIDSDNLKDDQYIDKFFKGDDNSNKKEIEYKHSKTIIELKRDHFGKWIDLFATYANTEIPEINKELIPDDYNRLVLIRINKISEEKQGSKKNSEKKRAEKTQGIIGFYYKTEKEDIADINIFRYLLLLRPALSLFIENHHQNDEFRDWQIAEIKQKTSLLTGHGREMLLNVARNRRGHYNEIVSTLLIVQRLIIDKKEEEANTIYHSGRIKKIFEAYYQTKDDNTKIDNNFLSQIEKMALEIFEFEEIENSDPIEKVVKLIPNEVSFKFHKEILRMICFELLVNAKKNRWLFSGETIQDQDRNELRKNIIWIEAKMSNGNLEIIISSTGPEITNTDLKKINRKKGVKRYDSTSGIELINTILTEFDLGSINFNQSKVAEPIYKFIATLTLKQNHDG